SVSWNTLLATNGSHTLTATARDAAGNTLSAGITVTVDNAAPVISSVGSSALTSISATISWTTDENSDSQVEYGLTTAYGNSTTLNLSMLTSHSVFLTGLSINTLYHYTLNSKDSIGNLA